MEQFHTELSASRYRDDRIVEWIAQEVAQPLSLVERIYEEELSKLLRSARITQFVNVLAMRRVRQRLRHNSETAGADSERKRSYG